MDAWTKRLELVGEVVGVGIDVVVRGRVSERLSQRRFSIEERATFADRLEIPFAARESLVKAVGGPGMLGAPLREMNVALEGDELRLVAGPAYRAILVEQSVDRVWLSVLSIDEAHVVVAAVALRGDTPTVADLAWAHVRIADADPSLLTDEELVLTNARPIPSGSIATRQAARIAARACFVPLGTIFVRGGGEEPPELIGLPGAKLSLAHEDELAVALVCVTRP